MEADIPLPPALERLLAELEAPSPSIQESEVDLTEDEYGGFFRDRGDGGESQEDAYGARSRARVCTLRAIGNCTSLTTIYLSPFLNTDDSWQALQQSNQVLEWMEVTGWEGLGSGGFFRDCGDGGESSDSAPLTRILRALMPRVTQAGGSGDHSSNQTPGNRSNVKTLHLYVPGVDYASIEVIPAEAYLLATAFLFHRQTPGLRIHSPPGPSIHSPLQDPTYKIFHPSHPTYTLIPFVLILGRVVPHIDLLHELADRVKLIVVLQV